MSQQLFILTKQPSNSISSPDTIFARFRNSVSPLRLTRPAVTTSCAMLPESTSPVAFNKAIKGINSSPSLHSNIISCITFFAKIMFFVDGLQ